MTATSQKLIVQQLDRILARIDEVKHLDGSDWDALLEVSTSILAALDRLAQPDSQYRRQADDIVRIFAERYDVMFGRLGAILRALRNDYADGSMQSVEELIHANLFGDFCDMAEHLLEQGYKDAAAVIAGGVLEEHLRKLCTKNGIDTTFKTQQQEIKPKKLDTMNAELAKTKVYNQSDQKLVTAWAAIRNSAAHGKYGEYSNDKVDLMIRGLRNFIAGLPA